MDRLQELSNQLGESLAEIELLKHAFDAIPMAITIFRLDNPESWKSLVVVMRSPFGIYNTRLKKAELAPTIKGKCVTDLPDFGNDDLYEMICECINQQDHRSFAYHAPETPDAFERDFYITLSPFNGQFLVMTAERIL